MSAGPIRLTPAELTRLAELAEKMRDDTIADSEVVELETLLAESAAAREAFVELALVVADLRHFHGRLTWAPPPVVAPARPAWRRWLAPVALAAGIALLALFTPSFFAPRPPATRAPVATITNASGAVLLAADRPISTGVGTILGAGAWELQAGLLEVTYANGVVLLLESPTRFALRDPTSVELHDGNLSAKVPPAAVGFAVDTPSGRIVDLGTEFGVSAGATSSEVHVFKGEVIVKTPNEPDPLRLTSQRASRIDTRTQTPAGIDFQPERFFRSFAEPSTRYSELVRQWDPVAYYRMRLTPTADRLDDFSSRQLHASIIPGASQCSFVPGKIGAALRLSGPSARSYAVVPDFPLAANALTVCAWVRADSRPRWATIAKNWAKDQGVNHGGQFHFGLFADEGGLEVHLHNGEGDEVWAREGRPLPLGDWQFVAFTFDGTTLRLFRNGREVAAVPCDGLSQFAPSALGIGVKLDASGQQPELNTPGFWDGALDELGIFHHALSPDQISRLSEADR